MQSEIDDCIVLVGGAQSQCWAQLDQLLMEEIVPWVPYLLFNETRIVSDRVASLSIDQLTTSARAGSGRARVGIEMRRAAAAIAALALAACGGAAEEAEPPAEQAPATTQADEGPRGGTLRVGLVDLATNEAEQTSPDGQAHYALDPQAEYWSTTWELFRCCLLRTLLSYNGTPTAEGGAELRPDLATELPTVSADGLTWTFRLRPGLRYAPPYDETEIVAADVIRAVERILLPANPSYAEAQGRSTIGSYARYYMSLIEGAEAFAAGEADTISGLETPDDHTLVVHLTEPAGDLGHRFSLPATAPIPPGAAEGHDDGYGPFLVASGPYMVESYDPGSALKLVRNPSWTAETDLLRVAYADRIELTLAADAETAYAEVENGGLDLVLDQPAPAAIAERYRADPALAPRLIVIPQDRLVFAAMNLAQPPFDDVHVRRAASLAVDKAAIVDSFGPGGARIATHVAPDSLEGNLLLDYDPFATPGYRGDMAAAREEMAASRYDIDGDGRCDRPACSNIRAIAIDFPGYVPAEVLTLLKRDLAQIGLELEVEAPPPEEFFPSLGDQAERHALHLNFGWEKDFPNGSGWFSPALDSDDPTSNPSLVGAEPEQLADWGYPVTSVPSVDDEIATCVGLTGGAQNQCWATLDQTVMEQIVPWIPYAVSQPHPDHLGSCREHLDRPAHDAALARPDRTDTGLVKRLAALTVIATVFTACGGEQAGQQPAAQTAPETTAAEDLPRGGTLRVATADPNFDLRGTYISADGAADYTLDPQKTYDNTSWELFRCCLLRTLMSFNGQPTSQGGAELRPDLAEGTPEVAPDGLTWTFHLERGQRYAPPYADQEIVAADFVRALERVFTPTDPSFPDLGETLGSYSAYYEVIEGTTAFKSGEADSISGLETPDNHTLVVHLSAALGRPRDPFRARRNRTDPRRRRRRPRRRLWTVPRRVGALHARGLRSERVDRSHPQPLVGSRRRRAPQGLRRPDRARLPRLRCRLPETGSRRARPRLRRLPRA